MDIVKRAFSDTLGALGLPDRLWKLALSLPPSALFVGLLWWWSGEEKAVTEASDYVLYFTAFIGAAFIPCFLWHLWLAPYRILNEKLEGHSTGNVGGDVTPALPSKVDVLMWDGTPNFQLGDAACLWVEVEPHNPIYNMAARAKFAKLSGAIISGQLHFYKHPLRGLSEFLNGQTSNPRYSDTVSAVGLKKYAQSIGDMPKFLESVKLPMVEAQKTDD